jgi:hypothetical protein
MDNTELASALWALLVPAAVVGFSSLFFAMRKHISRTVRAVVWTTLTPVAVSSVTAVLFTIFILARPIEVGNGAPYFPFNDVGMNLFMPAYFLTLAIVFSLPLSLLICSIIALPVHWFWRPRGVIPLKVYIALGFIISFGMIAILFFVADISVPRQDALTSVLSLANCPASGLSNLCKASPSSFSFAWIYLPILLSGPLASYVFWWVSDSSRLESHTIKAS